MKYTDWYCVQVAAGCEKKAKADLLARKAVLEDRYVESVEVPESTNLVIQKSGKRKVVRTKLLPGYIIVQVREQTIEKEDGTYYKAFPAATQQMIRETFNVLGFAGPDKNKPRKMRPKEVKILFDRVDATHLEVKSNVQIDYNEGDILEVVSGPFTGYKAEVMSIQGQKILAHLDMFGRTVPTEFSPNQLYKNQEQ